jgi:hypothetical protein
LQVRSGQVSRIKPAPSFQWKHPQKEKRKERWKHPLKGKGEREMEAFIISIFK